jgi:hypothetical protein
MMLLNKNRTGLKASWDSLAEYLRIRLMGMIKTRDMFSIKEASRVLHVEPKVCRNALRWLLLEKKIEGSFELFDWFKPGIQEQKFLEELEADYRKWKENSREKGT